jgi:multisubunit Na+/H+ antiporter MnhB subunit
MLELYVVMGFMLIAALVAVSIQGLLSSVISVGAVGMGLCVMFLLLKAPDLAITQLVVEILCLVIMIRATIGRGISRVKAYGTFWILFVFIFFSGCFLAASYLATRQMPLFGQPLMRVADYYVQNSLPQVGAANIVASIILDWRGYDTLGEATVLFTSVLAVLAIMRRKGRKKIDERDESHS